MSQGIYAALTHLEDQIMASLQRQTLIMGLSAMTAPMVTSPHQLSAIIITDTFS